MTTLPASATATSSSNGFSFRAVLCFAPPLSKKTEFPLASAFPTCTSKFELTAKNLGVDPNNSAAGFKSNTVAPDPRFLRFRSTPNPSIASAADVLLPGINAKAKSERFVLGPARLTRSDFKSATAVKLNLGQWVVNYRLTPAGSKVWNAFAKRQFHAMIAVVANGQVYSAPLIQPANTHFYSFHGTGEISGAFTKTDAVDLAKWMSPTK
ncbi:MAG TPA: hypothetical protein VIJ08_01520 [Acidimicrobiales bacterium]